MLRSRGELHTHQELRRRAAISAMYTARTSCILSRPAASRHDWLSAIAELNTSATTIRVWLRVTASLARRRLERLGARASAVAHTGPPLAS